MTCPAVVVVATIEGWGATKFSATVAEVVLSEVADATLSASEVILQVTGGTKELPFMEVGTAGAML